MRKRKCDFQSPAMFFAAGFFVGLFVRFLPLFILLMLLFLAAGGITKLCDR
ncbi:MAG: hypothetical protein IJ283_04555 [Oscillospiraceae bacterium]|nr:hypothetical protein [Oscillospiraceae bacterium]